MADSDGNMVVAIQELCMVLKKRGWIMKEPVGDRVMNTADGGWK